MNGHQRVTSYLKQTGRGHLTPRQNRRARKKLTKENTTWTTKSGRVITELEAWRMSEEFERTDSPLSPNQAFNY